MGFADAHLEFKDDTLYDIDGTTGMLLEREGEGKMVVRNQGSWRRLVIVASGRYPRELESVLQGWRAPTYLRDHCNTRLTSS